MAHNNNRIFVFLLFFIVSFLFTSKNVFAQQCPSGCDPCWSGSGDPACSVCPPCPPPPRIPGEKDLGTLKGLGALSTFINTLSRTNPGSAANAFSNFISTAIGVMTAIAIIWFIFTLFLGAIAWISSGGDKAKLQNAQKQITTGLTGLVIVIAAIFLVKIIGIIFGIDILNLTKLINDL